MLATLLFTKEEVPYVCFSLPPCCLLQEELTPCYTKLSGVTVVLSTCIGIEHNHDTHSEKKGYRNSTPRSTI